MIEHVEDNSRLAAHTTKLRSITEIEHDAKKALNIKKIQIRADLFRQGTKGVGVSRHMLHYDSVKRITGEVEEELQEKRAAEAQQRRRQRRREKALLKKKQQLQLQQKQWEEAGGVASGSGNSSSSHGPESAGPGSTVDGHGQRQGQGQAPHSLTSLELDIHSDDELSISAGGCEDDEDDSFDEDAFESATASFAGVKSPPSLSRATSASGNALVVTVTAALRPASAPMLKSPSMSSSSLFISPSPSRQNSGLGLGQSQRGNSAASASAAACAASVTVEDGHAGPISPLQSPHSNQRRRSGAETPPGSAGRRRSGMMGGGAIDPRLLLMQQMKLQEEEAARAALMQKIKERERRMRDNKKYAENRALLSQWLRVIMCISRTDFMTETVRVFRHSEILEKQRKVLLHAVVRMQIWWILTRLKLKMRRNPVATMCIRILVMQRWRRNAIRRRHFSAALVKEFLIESLVLKDIGTKLYAYRKKVIRIQRYVRSFIVCRNARILLISLYVDKVRARIKREKRAKEARQERLMKRELQEADGFGAIMLQIDGVQKQIDRVLEEEAVKAADRAADEARDAARRQAMEMHEARLAGRTGLSGHLHQHTSIPSAPTHMGGVMDVSQASSAPGVTVGVGVGGHHQSKSYLRKKNSIRAKFPTPDVFIHRLLLSPDIGCKQLQQYRRIVKLQRLQHWRNFDIRQRRKALSNNPVNPADVISFLKAPPPSAATMVVAAAKRNGRRGAVGNNSISSMKKNIPNPSNKKNSKEEPVGPQPYDDSKLISHIVDIKQSIIHFPFLLLTGSKQMLLDEIKSLSHDLFP